MGEMKIAPSFAIARCLFACQHWTESPPDQMGLKSADFVADGAKNGEV
jgi:hypothetical protein